MELSYWSGVKGIALIVLAASLAAAQTIYQPKFHGDPAHSDSEAIALGYMRTVLRAEHQYQKKNSHYAATLADLVHTGTFTRRMVDPNRGDYTVGYRTHKDGFILIMTPKQLDAEHRSFYAEDDAKIHAEETKAANEDSPILK
jgi:opacity protein-like surface antigen